MIGLTLAAVFVASFALVVGTYVFLSRRNLARHAAARRRIRDKVGRSNVARSDVKLWRDDSASAIPVLNNWLKKTSHTQKLRQDIRAAGVDARPATIMLTAIVLGATGVYAGWLRGSLPLGLAFGVVGLFVPYLFLRWKKKRRLEKFESQLPEAIDMLINATRAGYSFQTAMELVGQEFHDPLGGEFAQFYEEQRLGMDVRSALLALQDRVNSLDLKMFITAVLIQRETGGNLSEVLGNISHVIRERFRLQGELRTLTSQVRLSSKILGALPIIVVLAISLLDPTYMEPLFKEPAGRILLISAGVAQAVGFAIMWKLSNIEI